MKNILISLIGFSLLGQVAQAEDLNALATGGGINLPGTTTAADPNATAATAGITNPAAIGATGAGLTNASGLVDQFAGQNAAGLQAATPGVNGSQLANLGLAGIDPQLAQFAPFFGTFAGVGQSSNSGGGIDPTMLLLLGGLGGEGEGEGKDSTLGLLLALGGGLGGGGGGGSFDLQSLLPLLLLQGDGEGIDKLLENPELLGLLSGGSTKQFGPSAKDLQILAAISGAPDPIGTFYNACLQVCSQAGTPLQCPTHCNQVTKERFYPDQVQKEQLLQFALISALLKDDGE